MSASIVVITLLCYLSLLFGVSRYAARKSSDATFFTGGRSTHRLVAAIAMVGAAMSGVSYISVPGSVLADGYSYLQTTAGFFVGYMAIAFILVPLYYRHGVVSLYEYLDHRFGVAAHRTGAWFFFLSKTISASLRAYVVCVVLQSLLFDALGIPFSINALVMTAIVWLYTRRGGVRSVVWVEMLKSIVMVSSIIACVIFIIAALGYTPSEAIRAIAEHDTSRVLFFDSALERRYFWKQFIAGIFLVVAMTGLDQDMMQTVLSCRNKRDAQRSLVVSIFVQMAVITLFLLLGTLFYIYAESIGLSSSEGAMPLRDAAGTAVVARGDDMFGFVATSSGLPVAVGVLFLLGLAASTYSAAGSALTALTTSFTLDILDGRRRDDRSLVALRRRVHFGLAVVMWLLIIIFEQWSTKGVIALVFTMASYTYGPLLGMFLFGLMTKRRTNARYIPLWALLSPVVSYLIATNSESLLGGYTFSYEILIVNGAIMFLGMWIGSRKSA